MNHQQVNHGFPMIVAALILGIFPSFGCFPAEPRPAEFLCVCGSADELESPVRWFLRAELEKNENPPRKIMLWWEHSWCIGLWQDSWDTRSLHVRWSLKKNIRFDIEIRVFPMARKVNHEAFKTKKKVDPPSTTRSPQVTIGDLKVPDFPDFPDRRGPMPHS